VCTLSGYQPHVNLFAKTILRVCLSLLLRQKDAAAFDVRQEELQSFEGAVALVAWISWLLDEMGGATMLSAAGG
jgi:hypothetical protein